MRYLVVAVDYDGTIAEDGHVSKKTFSALKEIRASGRRLLLVTGREVKDIRNLFPDYDLFDMIVAENGAVLYRPSDKQKHQLAEPPSKKLVKALRQRGIEIDVGKTIISAERENEAVLLEVISELGLEMQIIFNKNRVMVVAPGVNKASGLAAALKELEMSHHDVLAVGDAENDLAFLAMAEGSVAVANALDSVKDQADLVTKGDHGAGVIQVTKRLLKNNLVDVEGPAKRNRVLLGYEGDREVTLSAQRVNLLVTGTSGSGKSTVVTGILERLAAQEYQLCIVDPEGDYEGFDPAIVLGDAKRAPSADEVMEVLQAPVRHVVANLLGVPLNDRPKYFARLLPRLVELRSTRARPHWIAVDEAHHVMPADWEVAGESPPPGEGMIYITVHPDLLYPQALDSINVMIVTGKEPAKAIKALAKQLGAKVSIDAPDELEDGHALLWQHGVDGVIEFKVEKGELDLKRHGRKYAEGNLGERSFFFIGPEGKLNLQASNLHLFSQIGDGVDDETWMYHLRRNDYSEWFDGAIKDSKLAKAVRKIEDRENVSPTKSRRLIREAIETRFTLPADEPSGIQDEDAEQ